MYNTNLEILKGRADKRADWFSETELLLHLTEAPL